jgi:two-component system, NarL family, sensor histidine kinase UhpB
MNTTMAVERPVASSTSQPREAGARRGTPEALRPVQHSLLWHLFLANGGVLALIVVLLAVTPIEITAPFVTIDQLLILLAGLAVMLAINLILLRRVLSPLQRLTELMRTVDPDRPGRRLDDVATGQAEVAELAGAFNEMLDRLELERRESARVALAAQERERQRVARELHDEIGQSLTAVTLKAQRAADNGAADPAAELRGIADDIRSSLDDVRRIARELRPEALDDLGLVNALITLCSRVSGQGEVRVERELEAGLPPLHPDVELVVYRVAQEALTNVVRHARAKRATVSLKADDGEVVLRVRDDGRGLPAELPKGTAGLGGMRERALLVGGRLTIQSEPDQGTEVTLEVASSGADA